MRSQARGGDAISGNLARLAVRTPRGDSRRAKLVHPFRVPHEVCGGDRRVDTGEHLLEVGLGDGQVGVLLLEVLDLVAVETLVTQGSWWE